MGTTPKAAPTATKPGEEEAFDLTRPLREGVARFAPTSLRARVILLALLAIASALIFGELLATDLSAMEKFLGSALIMVLTGEAMRGLMGWDGFAGLILLKDRSTLDWIDRQAHRFAPLWSLIADVGLVMGFGLGSYLLLGPQARKPKRLIPLFVAGFALLFLFSAVIMPSAYEVLRFSVSGTGELNAASAHMRTTNPLQGNWDLAIAGQTISLPLISLVSLAVLLLGGLAASATLSILLYGLSLVAPLLTKTLAVLLTFAGQKGVEAVTPPPGGVPLIPGVNLDLVSGIVAMAVLLVVHELSHAFLARIHNIRLDSAGVLFFGILPFGAFVDPDEKELGQVEQWKANQVIVAGSAMNMAVAMLAFCLFLGLAILNSYYPMQGIGAKFILRTLGLIFTLNVLVGVVNLLPIPLVDGHRLMVAAVKHKLIAQIISWAVIAAFVLNFLPWLFK